MLGLGLTMLTGGALRPYYVVVAATFKARVEADGGSVENTACLTTDVEFLTQNP